MTICCLGKSVCPISRLRFATSIRIATAKGVLRPTLCNARATDAKPKVIPVGRLLQEQIGTSTSDIPGGNLSILILNRKSTAHNHNQHAGNIGSTCAHLRKSAAGRAPPEPGTRKMAGTQNAHHTHNTKHTHNIHTQMHNTAQHSTEHTQHTHNIAQHTTAQNGTHAGRPHTEHTTQTTHKTHTKQAHTQHTHTHTHTHTQRTRPTHPENTHTHNQVTQAHTHTHTHSPSGCSASGEQGCHTKSAQPNSKNQPAAARCVLNTRKTASQSAIV